MKIFFDATFGEPWVMALERFFYTHKDPKPLFQHIHGFSARGANDDEWFPELLRREGIVITGDRGNKKPRLPDLCKTHKKTHIILSGTLQNSTQFNKARAIVVLWPEIVKVFDCPRGSRFQMQTIDKKHEHFRLLYKG